MKADDGADAAAEVMIAALIARFLPMDEAARGRFSRAVAAAAHQLARRRGRGRAPRGTAGRRLKRPLGGESQS